MAVDTLLNNKLRSALTVLGVVIGVTSIVGMTSLIRGFGDQFEALINQLGANTVYIAKFSISSFASGKGFLEVIKRPNITEEDGKAIKASAPSAMIVGWQLGNGPGSDPQRLSYRGHLDEADSGDRLIGQLRRHQLHRDGLGPVLQPLRGGSPAQRDGAGLQRGADAVSRDRSLSARTCE